MSETNLQPAAPPPLPDIIQRYVNGEPVAQLAHDCHVSRYTIYNWMLAGIGDRDYEQIVTQAMVRGIADADEALEQAQDALSFNKAHARARLTRMDFERRRPKLYGPQQQIESQNTITVIVQREQRPVIDITDHKALPTKEANSE